MHLNFERANYSKEILFSLQYYLFSNNNNNKKVLQINAANNYAILKAYPATPPHPCSISYSVVNVLQPGTANNYSNLGASFPISFSAVLVIRQ